ncbi:hypothetical protein GIB67_005544 [Kingdonia uniflora]|uniref:Uncharacterized protein n=1 Tax=Kingdonia uniflora TaxID=39325 RepID=A0A7J7NI85_9MAGN|nr:hypothetical protein GIB67_005544 [Kingdonia uniflora]
MGSLGRAIYTVGSWIRKSGQAFDRLGSVLQGNLYIQEQWFRCTLKGSYISNVQCLLEVSHLNSIICLSNHIPAILSNKLADQTSVTPTQQTTTTQGGGYDYYIQQQQQQPSIGGSSASVTDNTGYNYAQPQAPVSNCNQQENAYGGPQQGYSQDGYGGGNGQAQVGYD